MQVDIKDTVDTVDINLQEVGGGDGVVVSAPVEERRDVCDPLPGERQGARVPHRGHVEPPRRVQPRPRLAVTPRHKQALLPVMSPGYLYCVDTE